MLLLNQGLFLSDSVSLTSWLESLQFDRDAILAGQWWRLITGNLVHWSAEHFLLDVGAFLIVGLLYERRLNRHYPWILLTAALAVGCAVLLFRPDMETYRGLSGVDSGQFAAALGVEALLAAGDPRRWIWVAPAAAVFLVKTAYESATGVLFFGTESLGDLGQPIPLAHAAGTAAAAIWLLSRSRLPGGTWDLPGVPQFQVPPGSRNLPAGQIGEPSVGSRRLRAIEEVSRSRLHTRLP